VLSARGRPDEAIALARESAQILADAQNPSLQGDVCMELAEILAAAGRPAEAVDAASQALAFYERKGIEPASASTRAFLEALTR